MKKVLKVIGIIVLALIIFVLIAGLFVSKDYHLEKNITINAPREKVWGLVNSFEQMDKWNPWKDPDPNIQISYEGQQGTVGSVYKWEGNNDVGAGNQTFTKLEPMSRTESHINFIKPFKGEADVFLQLDEVSGGTKVNWGFDTRYSYPMNTMLLFIDMDKMMGEKYDTGLARLKKLAEQ
ncbi:SRPBCC family protein [Foetidibacter luteolus]|uniref:SRPBCC family protein n=1 Tax=Foetidibacter luteolus TaxID=2608880 RepID=UPI00129A81B5|nr:SRPBCC family protein [Foetidibacter luteolus]